MIEFEAVFRAPCALRTFFRIDPPPLSHTFLTPVPLPPSVYPTAQHARTLRSRPAQRWSGGARTGMLKRQIWWCS
ncbi:hypothetical protein C8Q79DRAFT_977959 [Trametes meyenii]|nr:hypothetical protein C8Q79DRAFT_977959 [Trametes meyenii]